MTKIKWNSIKYNNKYKTKIQAFSFCLYIDIQKYQNQLIDYYK